MSLSLSRRLPRAKLLCALVASCFATEPFANPVGPSVVAGQATFATAGKSLTVTNSPNAIINWQGFSIGTGEITRFQQQSAASAVLNRVVGQDPSAILGTLTSNGRVYLVNPNGILFGQGSRVDVAGLVATTLNLSNNDFLAGRLNFEAGAVASSIVNQGEIVSASGGRILLIAPDVQNHGLISSPKGEVVLAAGKSVQLVEVDLPQLKVEVQAGGEALNVGQIIAEGGKIGVYAGLINQRGVVRADSVSQDATGKIVFRSSDTTILDAGSVTSASGAKGGEIQVLGNKVGLLGDAKVDASGDTGGGTVLVGGEFQGKNPEVQNAFRNYVGPETSIQADALVSGDGGKVIVWSDDATRAYGTISAKGGAESGNGGFVEVSGKNWLDFSGTVNTSAVRGATGTLLLDPSNVNIGPADSFSGGSFSPSAVFGGATGTASISWSTIDGELTNNNVVITTSGGGGTGNITVAANSPTLNQSNNLWLVANNDITVGGTITNTGGGNLGLYAGWNGGAFTYPTAPTVTSGTGSIFVNQNISISNTTSELLLKAGKDITVASGVSVENLTGYSHTLTLNAVGGSITANSGSSLSVTRTAIALPAGGNTTLATLNLSAGGNITLTSSTLTATGTNPSAGGNGSIAPGGAVAVSAQAGGALSLDGSTISATGGNASPAADSNLFSRGAATVTLSGASGVSLIGPAGILAIGGAGSGTATEDTSISISSSAGNVLVSNGYSINARHRTGNSTPALNDALLSINAAGSIVISGSPLGAGLGRSANTISLNAGTTIDVIGGSSVTVDGGAGLAGATGSVGTNGGAGGPSSIVLASGGTTTIGAGSITATGGAGGVGGNSSQSLANGGNGGAGGAASMSTTSTTTGSVGISGNLLTITGGNGAAGGTPGAGGVAGSSGTGGNASLLLDALANGGISLTSTSISSTGGDNLASGAAGKSTLAIKAKNDVSISGGSVSSVSGSGSTGSGTTSTVLQSTSGNIVVDGGAVVSTDDFHSLSTTTLTAAGTVMIDGASTWVEAIGEFGSTASISGANGVAVQAGATVNTDSASYGATGQIQLTTTGGTSANIVVDNATIQALGRDLVNPGLPPSGNSSIYLNSSGDLSIVNASTIKAVGGLGLAGANNPSGPGFAGGAGGLATMSLAAARNVAISSSTVTATAGAGGNGGNGSGGSGGAGGSGGLVSVAIYSDLVGDVTVSNSTISGTAGNGAFGGTGTVSGANGAGAASTVTLDTAAGNGNVSLTSSSIGVTAGTGPSTAGSASLWLTSTGTISADSSSLSASGGNCNLTSCAGAGTGTIVLDASGSISLPTATAATTLSATAGNSPGVVIAFPPPYSYKTAIIGVLSGSGDIDSNASITSTGDAGTAFIQSTTYTNSIVLNAPLGHIHAITPGSGLLTVQNGVLLASVRLNAKNGIGQVGAPIRIADDFAAILATNTTANDVVLSLLSGSWYLDGSYMSVSNTASAPGGLIDLTAQAGDVYVASGYTLSSPNGSISLTAAGASAGSGLIDIASGTTVSAPNGNITLTADNQTIGGAMSAATGTAALRPYDISRQVNIESSASVSVLSLTPTEIQNVTAGTLEIGSTSGTGSTIVSAPLTSANVNASTLRLYHGSVTFNSGADVGTTGSRFDHNLEVKPNASAFFDSSIYLANNRSLTVLADRDGLTSGSVSIGPVTLQVGVGGNTTGIMDISGRSITATSSGGTGGLIEVAGGGTQTLTATAGDITFQNSNSTSGTLLVQAGTNTQTINATGALRILGGTGTNTSTIVTTGFGAQSVSTGSIVMAGGNSGSGNFAHLSSGGGQTLSAGGVSVTGGSAGTDNNARIVQTNPAAAQNITVTGGNTLALQGGGGTDNNALIWSQGASQQIAFAAGGNLNVTAGNGASADWASISATSGSQSVIGAPAITLRGGTGGAGGLSTSNYALITVDSAQPQTINASSITLTGGDSGSANRALILHTSSGAQTVNASGITIDGGLAGSNEGGIIGQGGQTITAGAGGLTLRGGAGGTGAIASISQQGLSSDQSITINNDGIVTLTGGGGTSNDALISNQGKAQTLAFTTGGRLIQQGGNGASGGNEAAIYNTGVGATTQTISFGGGGAIAPEVKLTGGSVGDGNSAGISSTGNQIISGNPDITLLARLSQLGSHTAAK